MNQKLITFIVPCYNSEEYMDICIESLLTGGDKVEILVVNDGSTDRTGEIAAEYARKYPNIVRVLTQENGGHGEGINHGLREATGTYFKVVDSDDWLDETALKRLIQRLILCERRGGIDLMVCNYVYGHKDNPKLNRTIRYKNVFPQNGIFGWEQTKPFLPWQYLTLHSCIHRTQILRDCKLELPKHTFYEDNLFVYTPLPYVKRICYMNIDLYHYLIGREDQSVSEEALKKKCTHQILVSKKIFTAHDIKAIKKENPKLARYMQHEVNFMMTIATAFTRLNKTEEAEALVKEMWDELAEYNKKDAWKTRRLSVAAFINLPGKLGRDFGLSMYRLCHKIVPFN
ncbi:MAG: glycosyltransferase family A protein [Lachnospiraceae bacterium]|nr:glycosyltransferase family A protein [Lachnospiraceae bacterium]